MTRTLCSTETGGSCRDGLLRKTPGAPSIGSMLALMISIHASLIASLHVGRQHSTPPDALLSFSSRGLLALRLGVVWAVVGGCLGSAGGARQAIEALGGVGP